MNILRWLLLNELAQKRNDDVKSINGTFNYSARERTIIFNWHTLAEQIRHIMNILRMLLSFLLFTTLIVGVVPPVRAECTGIVPTCCAEVGQTCSIFSTCCNCSGTPAQDKATPQLFAVTKAHLVAVAPVQTVAPVNQIERVQSELVSENDQMKPPRLYILHRSLLI